MRYGTVYIELDAVQWTGENFPELEEFGGSENFWKTEMALKVWDYLQKEWIPVNPKDYIIKGLKNEFYPCDPEVFNRKYIPLTESHSEHRTDLSQ